MCCVCVQYASVKKPVLTEVHFVFVGNLLNLSKAVELSKLVTLNKVIGWPSNYKRLTPPAENLSFYMCRVCVQCVSVKKNVLTEV